MTGQNIPTVNNLSMIIALSLMAVAELKEIFNVGNLTEVVVVAMEVEVEAVRWHNRGGGREETGERGTHLSQCA